MSAIRPSRLFFAALVMVIAPAIASAQDIPIGATYICSGEHIYVESCNIRDLSDTATCMVGHPDKLLPNGMNSYTYVARGALKKLLPTCTQPSANQRAAAAAFQKRQQDTYNANEQKAMAQLNAPPPPAPGNAAVSGQPAPPKNAEERAIRRCVTSGRLAATCTGNSLLGAFGQMLGSVLPGANKQPEPGPTMAGVFEGPGKWRLDFIDGGVLVNCSNLSPNQEAYTLDFKTGRATLTINTTPRPLVLTLNADSTITGPGPVTLDGVIAAGYVNDTPSNATQKDQYGNLYDSAGNHVSGNANAGHTVFNSKRVTCPALNLSSKGASIGAQTMQTDVLKTMFGGDKGPPTPPGIRMHGIFASASSGFSVQFFPESVILGCGPDAARAYPYTVVADGAASYIKIDAPDHPLHLAFRADGSLDPGATGPYQVHGRYATGQDENDDFTFAPMEQTCNLAALAPSHEIPMTGGVSAATATATATATTTAAVRPDSAAYNNGGTLSTPAAPLGNATLTIASGLAPQPGAPSPLAGRPYIILRDSYANTMAHAGVMVPAGTSPYKFAGMACGNKTPDCQKINDAIKAGAISAARADISGSATLPGVPPGTYYLMISTRIGNQSFIWDHSVQLRSGANSLTLDQRSASPIN
jgi:hypothetical protein